MTKVYLWDGEREKDATSICKIKTSCSDMKSPSQGAIHAFAVSASFKKMLGVFSDG